MALRHVIRRPRLTQLLKVVAVVHEELHIWEGGFSTRQHVQQQSVGQHAACYAPRALRLRKGEKDFVEVVAEGYHVEGRWGGACSGGRVLL